MLIWIIGTEVLAHMDVTASAGKASYTVGFSSAKDCVWSGKSEFKRSRIDSAALEDAAPNVTWFLGIEAYALFFFGIYTSAPTVAEGGT